MSNNRSNRGRRGGGGGGRSNRSPQQQNRTQNQQTKNTEYEDDLSKSPDPPDTESPPAEPEPQLPQKTSSNKQPPQNPNKKGPPPKSQPPQNPNKKGPPPKAGGGGPKPEPPDTKKGQPAKQSGKNTEETGTAPGSILSPSASGIFQFGQPVHGFTPMSFNFSLPTGSDTAQPVPESELPSHSGPCVITTGGITYSLEQVPSQTSEENEESIFTNKAKLYRYDYDSKEWKERGVGDYKILKHKETGKYRILMRRDKILKICANHIVSPNFNLKSHHNFPETCWIYQTDCDFSDEDIKQWTFAVRFKTPEIAKEFKQIYETAQTEMQKLPPTPNKQQPPQTQPHHQYQPPQQQASPQLSSPSQNNNSSIKLNENTTIENAQQRPVEFSKISSAGVQLTNQLPPASATLPLPSHPPHILTLEILYEEILQIKSTLKNMQEEWIELKNIILSSKK